MGLNQAGQIAQAHWRRLAQHFAHIRLDAFVVMPNHIHGIIEIVDFPETSDTGATLPTSTSGRGEALSSDAFRPDPKRCSDNASPLRSVKPSTDDRPPNGSQPGPVRAHDHTAPPRSVEPPTDRPFNGPQPGSIGAIVGNYKSVSTRQINRSRRAPGTPVWQRNYHDRIIRHQQELDNIRAYIQTNPQNWAKDHLRLVMP
jgi:putative transposase